MDSKGLRTDSTRVYAKNVSQTRKISAQSRPAYFGVIFRKRPVQRLSLHVGPRVVCPVRWGPVSWPQLLLGRMPEPSPPCEGEMKICRLGNGSNRSRKWARREVPDGLLRSTGYANLDFCAVVRPERECVCVQDGMASGFPYWLLSG
jgi:hypothetical protein